MGFLNDCRFVVNRLYGYDFGEVFRGWDIWPGLGLGLGLRGLDRWHRWPGF